jgi:hypothetical protein
MNPTSSTLKATGSWGFIATLLIGFIAIIWPEIFARIPPGFEGALVVAIGMVAGKFQKENVLEARFKAEHGIK